MGLLVFFFPSESLTIGGFPHEGASQNANVFQVGQPQARCGVVGVSRRSKQSVIVMVFRQHCAVQGRSFEHFFMLAVLPLSSTVVLLFLRLEVILRLTLLHVFDFYCGFAVWAQQRSKLAFTAVHYPVRLHSAINEATWRQTPNIIVINDTSNK